MNVYAKPSHFLQLAHDSGLVTLNTGAAPNYCAQIARELPCACASPNGLVVNGRRIIVEKDQQSISGFPGYAFPDNCSLDEQLTLVTWLVRDRFVRFCTFLDSQKKLTRTLDSTFFQTEMHDCEKCFINTLVAEPIFCTKGIVVSAQNKGPTLESVSSHHASTHEI